MPELPQLKKRLGDAGEEIAAEHLKKKSFRILARGFRLFRGELDIIARDRKALVFIEVKTRRSTRFGEPAEAVTPRKQAQIRKIAQGYLSRNHLEDVECRFDIVSVLIDNDGRCHIEHFKNAF